MVIFENENYMKIVKELLLQDTFLKSLVLPRQFGKTYFFEQNYQENDLFVVKHRIQVKQTMMNLKSLYPHLTPKVVLFEDLNSYLVGRNLKGVKIMIDDVPLSHVMNIINKLKSKEVSCVLNLYTY